MSESATQETIQLVRFQIGKEEYAIHIDKAQEIIRMQEITPLPKTPDFIKGVINLRGHIIPVIDMHKKLGFSIDNEDDARIIVVKIGEKLIGMIVTSVSEVLLINKENLEEPPEIISGLSKEYIEAIGKINETMIVIIKIDKLLSEQEKEKLHNLDTTSEESINEPV